MDKLKLTDHDKIVLAIKIFENYMQEDEMFIHAEHDVIFAGPDPEKVSEKDTRLLEDLGWHPSVAIDCFSFYT